MRVVRYDLLQRQQESGFTNTGLTCQQYDLTLALHGTLPAFTHQGELMLATDQRGHVRRMGALEAALCRTRCDNPPCANRFGDTFHRLRAQVFILP